MKPSISFSKVKYNDLKNYFQIELVQQEQILEDWLNFDYALTESEQMFLKNLMQKHRVVLRFYNENQLKAKFIAPILNQVDFMAGKCNDWYEETISYEFKKVILTGSVDYMVAKGMVTPELPYFFIQEFKQTAPTKHPLIQLLGELMVALTANQLAFMLGAYIIGAHWTFVVMTKTKEGNYQYCLSKDFNSLELPDLIQIYTNLQTVKHKYCNIPLNQ